MTDLLTAWLATATYARACGAEDPAEVTRQVADWWGREWSGVREAPPEAYVELLRYIERISTSD
jgi:hypothetical protein